MRSPAEDSRGSDPSPSRPSGGGAPPRALAPGSRFGAYRLIRPLGAGGFAEVWEAESEADGRRVALKVLTELRAESARALERFQQEGRLAASLASPRCVYVFDAGAHEGFPYIAMELMTGGTLADRIQHGPLPPRTAVDLVLDVVEGLESAQQTGILHRDVKPSNVFLDADGRAKIGDFGISKSLEAASRLTQTGAFLGTPYYASPEQIAAEPLDQRSDLYSVGAMLYELVTGKLPYAGTNASQVLAQVLTRDPVPFTEHGVAVPAALQRVILRLLAKAREKRYQSYEQLRSALLPLSSRGLAPAGLAPRFGAIVLDWVLFFPLGLLLGTAAMTQETLGGVALAALVLPLLQFVYFALTERYWGGSVGKHALGLRVTTADAAPASLGRTASRAAVFLGLYAGPSALTQALTTAGGNAMAHPLVRFASLGVQVLAIGALVSTMRRRNGYAGVHEMVSGTRVMALLRSERATAVPRVPPPLAPAAAATYGPYQATGTLWREAGEALLAAHDPELHRDVWIHEQGGAAEGPTVERLHARGEGSLPWLQRGTTLGLMWDAYGAPPGTALGRWAAERHGLGWREMRDVLGSLARELESRFARDGSAGRLSSRHVWIEPSGRALLLDFPIEPASAPLPGDAAVEVTPSNWRGFLRRVATLGFGRDDAPLPEYARGIMARLNESGGAGSAAPSISDFRAALEGVAARPAQVTPLRRAGPFAVLAAVPALIVLMRLAVPLMFARFPAWYREVTLNSDGYLAALARADRAGAAADSATRRTADAVRIVFAAALLDARRAPPATGSFLETVPPQLRAALDSAVRRHPAPDSQQVADARAWLTAQQLRSSRLRGGLAAVPKAVRQSLVVLAWFGAAGVMLAVLLRGGLLFGLFGIAVVRADGRPAGRLRCGVRALVAWSPLLALLAFNALPRGLSFRAGGGPPVNVSASPAPERAPTPPESHTWLSWALAAVGLAGAAAAMRRPGGAAAERACGVALVPR